MQPKDLHTPITFLKGVGPDRAKILQEELGIHTFYDLWNYFPFRYVDRSVIYKVKDIYEAQAEIQVKGKIVSVSEVAQKRGKRLTALFEDETGELDLVWFQSSAWLKNSIKLHQTVTLYGRINKFGNRLSMVHPEMDYENDAPQKPIPLSPVYSMTERLQKSNISQRTFKKLFLQLIKETKGCISETLSNKIIQDNQLMSREAAYHHIHFPQNLEQLEAAQKRLKFDEIFFFQLGFGLKRIHNTQKLPGKAFTDVGSYFNEFYHNHLPFDLTDAQKRVIKEIRQDVKLPRQMNRLLQGDVGSGKTIVALMTLLLAIDNGFQGCFIAPTEILAQQHYQGVTDLLKDMNVKVHLLTGSTKTKDRKIILSDLVNGTCDILIGTHAVLEDTVVFKNMGLAIIDEQHRFGVQQRAKLWEKNTFPPHILVMTATPIPRTLAMSYYSDLDVSVIDELPKGRKPVKTIHKKDSDRLALFQFLKTEIQKGRQVYIVYPLISESEALDLKDLMDGYESISRAFPPPDYQLSIVHGQIKPDAKEFEMNRFVKGDTQIMVATTVIEVGVNVPNASVMVIENAERFGLSQLHQLRGRVGRGAEQSFCILMTKEQLTDEAQKRIETLCSTSDGFKIAEVDLEMRGPGNILGTRQSGNFEFKILDISQDKRLIALCKRSIDEVLLHDPQLSASENRRILIHFNEYHRNKLEWSRIS